MRHYIIGAIVGIVITSIVGFWMWKYYEASLLLSSTASELTYVRKIVMDDEYRTTSRRSDNDKIIRMAQDIELKWLEVSWGDGDYGNSYDRAWGKFQNIFDVGDYSLAVVDQNVLFYEVWGEWRQPWFAVHNNEKPFDMCQRRNRPVAFTIEDNKLILTLLNSCGWGSGEWYVSTYELQETGKWALNGCYNYHSPDPFRERAPAEHKDHWYDRWTTQLEDLPQEALSVCADNTMIEYFLWI